MEASQEKEPKIEEMSAPSFENGKNRNHQTVAFSLFRTVSFL